MCGKAAFGQQCDIIRKKRSKLNGPVLHASNAHYSCLSRGGNVHVSSFGCVPLTNGCDGFRSTLVIYLAANKLPHFSYTTIATLMGSRRTRASGMPCSPTRGAIAVNIYMNLNRGHHCSSIIDFHKQSTPLIRVHPPMCGEINIYDCFRLQLVAILLFSCSLTNLVHH